MDRGNPDDPDTTYNFDTNASPPDPVTPRWSRCTRQNNMVPARGR